MKVGYENHRRTQTLVHDTKIYAYPVRTLINDYYQGWVVTNTPSFGTLNKTIKG